MKPRFAVFAWAVRLSWAILPFAMGTAFAAAVAEHSKPVRFVGFVIAWAIWGGGLLATLVAHPLCCTVLRVLSPAVIAAALWAGVNADGRTGWRIAGVIAAAVVCFLAGSASFGEWCVNGPAYPNERRFLLRPAAALLIGPLALAAILVDLGVLAGPLLLAAKAWILGGVVTVVGGGAAWVLARSLHALSRRFVVFVPAGFVLHDLAVLRDPVLFPRRLVETIRAAPGDTDSLDLTNGAPGLALEAVLTEKVELTLLDVRTKTALPGATARFIFTPTRPGRVLAEAGRRRFA